MDRIHIVVAGRQNVGKSSFINTVIGQSQSIVSPIAGTTTDPVRKVFEIPGYAPVVFIDTAGIDDATPLGKQRIEKSFDAIKNADCGFLLFQGDQFDTYERELVANFVKYEIPFIIVHTHHDITPLSPTLEQELQATYHVAILDVDAHNWDRDSIAAVMKANFPVSKEKGMFEDLVHAGDVVVLVTPIDSEAPTDRLILPQVKAIRSLLDEHAIVVTTQPEQLADLLKTIPCPRLVVTDSQAFKTVAEIVPETIPVTSFSILLAYRKGDFPYYTASMSALQQLKDQSKVLILESCSHHTSCDDIGRVKIPRLLLKHTQKTLDFTFISSLDAIPEPLTQYDFVVQCGGCMVTNRQLHQRIQPFIDAQIPVTNYGMLLSALTGIFQRAIRPLQA